ncbi:MAG: glycosyltransferase family 2 protein [Planctomycetota bacterium]
MSISVVVPVYQELDNVRPLCEKLTSTLRSFGREYELIFVDDGSRDGTVDELRQLAAADPHVKLVLFRRNYGQTAAMAAGIQHATLDVVVTLDGDQQNDPGDIPMMVEALEGGYDLVHGWRRERQDRFLSRRLPSICANWLISRVTGFPIHDLGCTLKAIRREIAQELELVGEMHRFIPILAHQRGARCVEVVTRHHPRVHGRTKYGINRTFRVLLDLFTVNYLVHYAGSPMKFFGRVGLGCGAAMGMAWMLTLLMKLGWSVPLGANPLWLTGWALALASLQCLGLGLLAEVQTRQRLALSALPHGVPSAGGNYAIRERVNFSSTADDRNLLGSRRRADTSATMTPRVTRAA